jgi:hypothetical protein
MMVEYEMMHPRATALIPAIAIHDRPLVESGCGHFDVTTTKIRGIGSLCGGCYADMKSDCAVSRG